MWQLNRQTSRQTIGRHFLASKISSLKKKTFPCQIPTHNLCCPRRVHYHQAKCSGDTKKFKLFMNQDTSDSSDSVKEVVNPKKNLYSRLITLAYRKRHDKSWNNSIKCKTI